MSSSVQPLESLFDQAQGQALPLPADLLTLYGPLRFPLHPGKPYLVGNFVSTLDGVVSLNIPGQSGGGPISGFNPHDHLVMGLLRAVADAVVVGAGTLRAVPDHRWTVAVQRAGALSGQAIAQAVCEARPCQVILVEGGPRLLGDFFAEQLLDELFLTLAPQVAGRDAATSRPGLVEGYRFAPEHPLWGTRRESSVPALCVQNERAKLKRS